MPSVKADDDTRYVTTVVRTVDITCTLTGNRREWIPTLQGRLITHDNAYGVVPGMEGVGGAPAHVTAHVSGTFLKVQSAACACALFVPWYWEFLVRILITS